MTVPVANSPRTLATSGVTSGVITIVANSQFGQGYVVPNGGFTTLILNDCASLATASAGNQIASIPASVLSAGVTIPTSATTSGFTVSQLPSGVGIMVSAGTTI